jgi:6-phosphogluconolactonase (cycloisomerase 2 family)
MQKILLALTLLGMSCGGFPRNGSIARPEYLILAAIVGNAATLVPRFLYIGSSAGTISGYRIDPATGLGTSLGTVASPGSTPFSMAVDSQSRFLYVSCGGMCLKGYTIDSTTGSLTEISGSPFAFAGTNIGSVLVRAGDANLYATDNMVAGQVFSYSINQSTGALTAIGNNPAGQNPDQMLQTPDGTLYVANAGASPSITAHIISATGVVPAAASSYVTTNTTKHLALAGSILYSPQSSGTVAYVYSTSSAPALTALGTSIALGASPQSPVATPAGTYLYVALNTSTSIVGYSVNQSTGGLAALSGSPFTAALNNKCLRMEVRGRYLYSANFGAGAGATIYSIDSSGNLTQIGSLATGMNPCASAIANYFE